MVEFESIRANMNEKATEDLLTVWQENNRDDWSDEAFLAIHHILTDRQVTIPEQKEFMLEHGHSVTGPCTECGKTDENSFSQHLECVSCKSDFIINQQDISQDVETKVVCPDCKFTMTIPPSAWCSTCKQNLQPEDIFLELFQNANQQEITDDETSELEQNKLSAKKIDKKGKSKNRRIIETVLIVSIASVLCYLIVMNNQSELGNLITLGRIIQIGIIFLIAFWFIKDTWRDTTLKQVKAKSRKGKILKVIFILFIAFLWWFLLVTNYDSRAGAGITIGQMLQLGFILLIAFGFIKNDLQGKTPKQAEFPDEILTAETTGEIPTFDITQVEHKDDIVEALLGKQDFLIKNIITLKLEKIYNQRVEQGKIIKVGTIALELFVPYRNVTFVLGFVLTALSYFFIIKPFYPNIGLLLGILLIFGIGIAFSTLLAHFQLKMNVKNISMSNPNKYKIMKFDDGTYLLKSVE